MPSFLDKLKRGMGQETELAVQQGEEPQEPEQEQEQQEKTPELEIPQNPQTPEKEEKNETSPESAAAVLTSAVPIDQPIFKKEKTARKKIKKEEIAEKKENPPKPKKIVPVREEKMPKEVQENSEDAQKLKPRKDSWFESEGQLAVDVYETPQEIIVQSAIAGVKPDELDISIEKDVVSIKGKREEVFEKNEKSYFYQECYWGRFSREIILPSEVDGTRAEASMKNGILTIRVPKIEKEKKRKLVIE